VEKLRNDNGIRLARRTVAKYREELKILPARLRKHS
jgi:DNA-directed RNA polymerase specialized sigma54-like protein